MLAVIADDCQVTKWNGDESAGKAAGVVLESYIVRVNETPVSSKKEIVALIQGAAMGSTVSFKLVPPAGAAGPSAPAPAPAPARAPASAPAPAPTPAPAPAAAPAAAPARAPAPATRSGVAAYAVEIQKTNAGFGMSTRPRIPQQRHSLARAAELTPDVARQ